MSKEMQEKTLNAINQTINSKIGNSNSYQRVNEEEIEWHEEAFITDIIKSIDVHIIYILNI